MRIVIELKRDAIPNVVLNQLYKHTAMQSTFGVIMLALDNGRRPKIMNLKELLEHYIAHRHEIVVRRTQFDLDAAPRPASTSSRASRSPSTTSTRSSRSSAGRRTRPQADAPAPEAVRAQREAERSHPQHAARQAHRSRDREAGGRAQGGAGARSRSCKGILASQAQADGHPEGRDERGRRTSSATTAAPRSSPTRASSRSRT